MTYIQALENYTPKNEQESRDLELILQFIKQNPDHLYRSNLTAHMTSSALVFNKAMTQVLFAYHNIFDSWSWVGGHADGNPDLLEVAIKEAKEETGLNRVVVKSKEIFMVDVIYVPNHIKHGVYVPDHLHLNVTFVLIADETDKITHKPDENQGVRWFDLDDALNHVSEPRMMPIYKKAYQHINDLKN